MIEDILDAARRYTATGATPKKGTLQLVVTGLDKLHYPIASWVFDYEKRTMEPGTMKEPKTIVTLSESDLRAVWTGASVQQLFYMGKIKIKGDQQMPMRLYALLGGEAGGLL